MVDPAILSNYSITPDGELILNSLPEFVIKKVKITEYGSLYFAYT